jgi:hypothetical protein
MKRRNNVLPIVAILLVVVLGAGIFVILRSAGNRDNRGGNFLNRFNSGGTRTFANEYPDCDKNATPVFTYSPLAVEKIGSIEPMGKTADGHVAPIDHIYVSPIDTHVPDNTYEIVMPADGRVVEISRMPAQYIGDNTGVELSPDDFRLVVSFSCRYYAIFIHVHKLSDRLAQELPIEPGTNKHVNIELAAGEVLAYLGPKPFDWTMVDTEVTLPGFLSPELYAMEPWKIHTISPFDVYAEPLKGQLEARSLRIVPPLGGKIDYDVPGTLIGNWFKEGTNGYEGSDRSRYWDGHLSIAPDNLNPAGIIYSTGNWEGKAAQYLIKGSFDPTQITEQSGPVSIDLVERSYIYPEQSKVARGLPHGGVKFRQDTSVVGAVLLQVMDAEKLKVEQFPGKTAAEVGGFTSAASMYER